MQKKKRNHYVPQAYLRGFAADPPTNKKIWVLGNDEGSPELKPIKNVAVRFYLYAPQGERGQRDYSFEDKLASLEQFFGNPIWKAISTDEVDTSDETVRRFVALTTAVMILRNPSHLEWMEGLHRRQVAELSTMLSMPAHVRIKDQLYTLEAESWPAYRDASPDDVKRMWLDLVGSAVWLAEILMKMRWGIFISDRPAFITSDNPVMIAHPSLQNRGLANPETILTFPLSPTRVLFMDNRHGEGADKYWPEPDVAAMNGMIWRESYSCMLSHRDPHDVLAEILADADRRGYA